MIKKQLNVLRERKLYRAWTIVKYQDRPMESLNQGGGRDLTKTPRRGT